MVEPTIVIDSLTHRFNASKPALNNISARFYPGQITGVVGPDGAGKTTLMRILAGLYRYKEGSIKLLGLDPIKDSNTLRLKIGYMPQKFGLYEDLTISENLSLYADLREMKGDQRQDRIKQLLELTDLGRFTDRLAGNLSGGMKQKLGLACALLGDPKILLLDEPGVGVDPISRRELWHIVTELVKGGVTVIWSTSYLEEAAQCSNILLMNEGEVLYRGAPSKLIDTMKGRVYQIQNIEGDKRAVLENALNLPSFIDGVIQGNSVRVVLKKDEKLPDIKKCHASNSATFVPISPRLEDAFIDLLGGGPGGYSVVADHMPTVKLPSDVDPDKVISAINLTRRFGTFTATDHVNFDVRQGEIFGLLGPNGAGKSTTFKMMCGLLTPSEGEAYVMGKSLKNSPGDARQLLGYMAQKFSLYGNLSTLQNLSFFSGVYGLKGKNQENHINEIIKIFNLTPYLQTNSGDLPLGYKQRLSLSCALMHQPPILFLDEPTSGVDPITRREFWTHINGLVRKGVTVLVTTHFMDEAEYCDRIGLVYRGQMIAKGSPDELKKSVADDKLPNPSMEDAFIKLIEKAEKNNVKVSS